MPTRSMIPNLVQTSNIGQNWQLGQNLSPENALKLQDIERRQQIANLFTQQAMTPKGAVKAGNRFMVAPSGWEHAATLMNAAAGAGGMYMAGQQRQDLADELVKTRATDLETLDASQRDTPGREADTLPQGQPATPSNLEYQFGNAPIDADTLTREKITQLLKMQGPTLKKPVTSNEGVAEALTAQRGVPPFVTQPSYYTLPEPGPKPPLAAPSEQEGVAAALTTQRSPTSLADPRAGAQPHPYYTMGQDEIPATQGPLRPAIAPVERTEQERTSGYMKGMTSSDPLVRRMAEFYAGKHENEKDREDRQMQAQELQTERLESQHGNVLAKLTEQGREADEKLKAGTLTQAAHDKTRFDIAEARTKAEIGMNDVRDKTKRAHDAAVLKAGLSRVLTDDELESVAKGVSNYQVQPPRAGTLNSSRIMARTLQLNPDYQSTNFTSMNATMKAFASGKEGNMVRSIGVVNEHLEDLLTASTPLANGQAQPINYLRNAIGAWTGNPAPTTFDAIKVIVGDEVAKSLIATGGTLKDREGFQQMFKAAQSPQQLAEAVLAVRKLLASQQSGLVTQYERATGRHDFYDQFNQKKVGSNSPTQTLETLTGYPGK